MTLEIFINKAPEIVVVKSTPLQIVIDEVVQDKLEVTLKTVPSGYAILQGDSVDPQDSSPGDVWIKRNSLFMAPIMSHTISQIGLTSPGIQTIYKYILKYKTQDGAVVDVPIT